MKRKWVALTVVLLISTLLLIGIAGCGGKKEPEIRIGGKNFSEQFIMAEMLGILIKENTNLKTSIQTNLAASVILNAIKSNQIDLYLEYTGTGLISMGMEPIGDSKQVYEIVKKEFDERFNIKWMEPYGFNNTYAMVVTKETAEKYNLNTISDMAKVANELTLGCTYVFTERDDGYPGLSKHYDFKFDDVKGMDPSLMYQALVQGSVSGSVLSASAIIGNNEKTITRDNNNAISFFLLTLQPPLRIRFRH
jgi:osmoprotectant transport system substrate-binding protein